jgi:threonine synthase
LSRTPYFARIAEFGFVSGTSSHEDRISTIRNVFRDCGQIIDTHTADGIKVGLEHRDDRVPLVCLETAQAVKFSGVIHEALGREPQVPAGFENLERQPQRFTVLDADVIAVKDFVERNCEP